MYLLYGGVPSAGVHQNGCCIMPSPKIEWMIRDTTILGNIHTYVMYYSCGPLPVTSQYSNTMYGMITPFVSIYNWLVKGFNYTILWMDKPSCTMQGNY